tara:strand:+ start:219 stop:548 length:330 start_codon:yes stop_codon:yes gene_type:complete
MNNGRCYHLAAILRRKGRIIKVGVNSSKTHPRFKRTYPDGTTGSHMHAEMNVIRFAKEGDEIEVMRFKRTNNEFAMAKPCKYCMFHIRSAGIKSVRYTDENGVWNKMAI